MSNTYQPRQPLPERQLAAVVGQAMGTDFEFVNVSVFGSRVILEGTAPSYIAKARAAESVRKAGYPIVENCLRVVPGIPTVRL